jgi:hypothetical protein
MNIVARRVSKLDDYDDNDNYEEGWPMTRERVPSMLKI